MEVLEPQWGPNEKFEKAFEQRMPMIKHATNVLFENHGIVISIDDASLIVDQAMTVALETYKTNLQGGKEPKSFPSWVWFKLNNNAIPSFVRKRTHVFNGGIVPREEKMDQEELENQADETSADSFDPEPHSHAFAKLRALLPDKKHQKFLDKLKEVAEETDKKQLVAKTTKKLGITAKEGKNSMRYIKKEFQKHRNLYKRLINE